MVTLCRSPPHLYLSMKGFSAAGTVKGASVQTIGTQMSVINLSSYQKCTTASCPALLAVECVPKGQKACTADAQGNIGNGNNGKANLGNNNTGHHNIGELALIERWPAMHMPAWCRGGGLQVNCDGGTEPCHEHVLTPRLILCSHR